MLITTTSELQGKQIQYLGLVSGEAIMGTNFVRDFFASITDIIGGRSATYEKGLRKGKDLALAEMTEDAKALGANAIIGVDLDYETVGQGMLMVVATGTAVKYTA
jgi:uncharacterized protein YbjQ (UPF0145 family)